MRPFALAISASLLWASAAAADIRKGGIVEIDGPTAAFPYSIELGTNLSLVDNADGTITLNATSGGGGGSGTVTSITAGTGLSGGTVTTSGTISLSTPVSLVNGGTNAVLTADNGAVAYSDATKLALLASTATANKVLLSGASATPTWSTPTFPNASATSGKYIKSDGTNWIASTGSASGTGNCTNQFVRNINADAAPTCATVGINDVSPTTGTGSFTFSNNPTFTGDPIISGNIDLDIQPTTGNAFDLYAYGSQLNLVDRTAAVPIAVFYQTGVEFPVATLKLGVAKTTTAILVLKNSATGNNLILQPGATSSELAFTLPTADGTNNQAIVTNGTATLSFSNVRFIGGFRSSTSITATTYYPLLSGASSISATTTGIQVPFQIICRNLYTKIVTAPGAGNSWTISPFNDSGAAYGSLSCAISGAGVTTCNDTTNNTGTITAGSGLKLGFVAGGTPAGTGGLTASMECEAN